MSLKKHMAILALMPELTYMNGGILDQKVSTEHYSYNPMRNALVRMSQMIVARFNHCLTFKDGYLYAIGVQNHFYLRETPSKMGTRLFNLDRVSGTTKNRTNGLQ